MLFKWVDYCEKYEDEIETWMSDELILRYATDDGIKKDHEYYLSSNEYKYNKEYFCKVILEENTIIAVVIILRGDEFPVGINPIIVNPQYRNKGYCTRIIGDFINNTNNRPVLQLARK